MSSTCATTRELARILTLLGALLLAAVTLPATADDHCDLPAPCLGAPAQPSPPACSAAATVTIRANNLLPGSPSVTLTVSGDLLCGSTTCTANAAVTTNDSYGPLTVTCTGTGVVTCTPSIPSLRPGAWVHRVTVGTQHQARRSVVVTPAAGSNVVDWTVYPSVQNVTTEAQLRAALCAVEQDQTRPALISIAPGTIPLADYQCATGNGGGSCSTACSTQCKMGGQCAGLYLVASGVVVDGLDDWGLPGATLSIATDRTGLLRVSGQDNVLRGLILVGNTNGLTGIQKDTFVFTGADAHGNSLGNSTVYGPDDGDAISTDGGAHDNLVVQTDVRGAEDKGVKADAASIEIRESRVCENHNGGIQATFGGSATARWNVVQYNVPDEAENGIFANDSQGEPSSLTTDGNIVRLNGNRGLSVVDNAVGSFANDYVADNQYFGGRVETTRVGPTPVASFTGVAFVCNHRENFSGSCDNDGSPCIGDRTCLAPGQFDCPGSECKQSFPFGVGAVAAFGACTTPADTCPCVCTTPPCPCNSPVLVFGNDSCDANAPRGGDDAFAWNLNTNHPTTTITGTTSTTTTTTTTLPGLPSVGGNLVAAVPAATVCAQEEQWEHGGTGVTCDPAAVLAHDVAIPPGISPGPVVTVDPCQAYRTLQPQVTSVVPTRPAAGTLVRLYGSGFNAIDGTTCGDLPASCDFCDPQNCAITNANVGAHGNRVRVKIGGVTFHPEVYAVTPTMIAFRMPVDCFGSASVWVATDDPNDKTIQSTPIALCGMPDECADELDGTTCNGAAGSTCTCGAGVCMCSTTTTSTMASTTSTTTPTTSTTTPSAPTTSTTTTASSTSSTTATSTTTISTTTTSTTRSTTTTMPLGPVTTPCTADSRDIACILPDVVQLDGETQSLVKPSHLRKRLHALLVAVQDALQGACAGRTGPAPRKPIRRAQPKLKQFRSLARAPQYRSLRMEAKTIEGRLEDATCP